MTFSATEAAFEGFRVVRRHPIAIVFWVLAYLVQFGLIFALFGGMLASVTAAAVEGFSSGGNFLANMEGVGEASAGLVWLMAPLMVVMGSVLSAAVARAVLRPSESAFGYLRLGGDELRVLAVSVMLFVVLMAAFILAFGLAGIAVELARGINPALAVLVAVLLIPAAFVFVIWFSTRLSLAVPITVAERRIAPLASFSVTKGNTLPLLGMAILAWIMSILVSLLVTVVTLPATMATGGENGLAVFAGQSALQIIQQAPAVALVWIVVNALQGGLQLAIIYAPFSAAYRDLKGLPHD